MNDRSFSNIWMLLEVIGRRLRLIVGLVFLATVIAVAVALLLPESYTANALLLPPQNRSGEGLARLAQVGSITGEAHYPGLITAGDVYVRILRSRKVTDGAAERLKLNEHLGMTQHSALRSYLDVRTSFRVTKEGLLSITAVDKDPQMAADITTAFIEELVSLNRELAASSARERRQFIENRMQQMAAQRDSARTELERFQMEHRAVDFTEQTRLAIEQAADLKVSLASLELEIQILEQQLGTDNPDLAAKRKRREIIRGQLDELEWGGDDSSFFSLPVAAVPGLQGQHGVLYSRLKVSETLYEKLLELYEEARIREAEDRSSISVLDWPVVPDIRSGPRRGLIVAGTFLISLIISVLLAVFLEYIRRLRETQPDDYGRLMIFVDAWLGWLPGVRRSSNRE